MISPVFGEPSNAQPTPATNGGTNSGSIPAVAISPFHGVLVRTTIQAKNSPITTATAVPPAQATSVLPSAKCTFSLPSTSMKLEIEIASR